MSIIEMPDSMRIADLKKRLQIATQRVMVLNTENINLSAMMAYKGGGTVVVTPEDIRAINKAQVKREIDKETGDIKYTFTAFENLSEEEKPKEESRILKVVH